MHPDIEKRLCPYSNQEFIPKRSNQVFALAEYRVAYHNDNNNAIRRKLSYINKQLMINYKVVQLLLGDKIEVIANKHFLRGAGFSFLTFTNVTKKEDAYFHCIYDVAFQKLNDEEYLIFRAK